jgi:hypothetical protein
VALINNGARSPQEPFDGGTSGFKKAFTGEDRRSANNVSAGDPSSRQSRIVGLCKLLSELPPKSADECVPHLRCREAADVLAVRGIDKPAAEQITNTI